MRTRRLGPRVPTDHRRRIPAPNEESPKLRLRSVVAHPMHLLSVPDAEGFREVHSHRRWRRRPQPRQPRLVPADLVGLHFNCLGNDHISAVCKFPSRCRTCHREGHRARNCPWGPSFAGAKRGLSPVPAAGTRGVPRRGCKHRRPPRRLSSDVVRKRTHLRQLRPDRHGVDNGGGGRCAHIIVGQIICPAPSTSAVAGWRPAAFPTCATVWPQRGHAGTMGPPTSSIVDAGGAGSSW
jgi:hypothetical protein